MGKIKQGILGGFNGKVGTVVGFSWKGKSVMRGRAQSIKKSNTAAQVAQREKFTLVSNFIQLIKDVIDVGFKKQARGMSASNAAFSYHIKNAVSGDAINPANVLISRGSLPNVEDIVSYIDNYSVVTSWTNNGGTGGALDDDEALVLIYNPSKGETISSVLEITRDEESISINFPESWEGDSPYSYLGFMSADGKRIATSSCQVVAANAPGN